MKKCSGFTLIEIMMVISIISILAVPMIYFEIHYSEKFYGNIYRQNMVEAANRTIEWMGRDIRCAVFMPNQWREFTASPKDLIIIKDRYVVIYSFDLKERALSRYEYLKEKMDAPPVATGMANDLDVFSVASTDNGRLFTIHLQLSKNLVNYGETVTMTGLALRRRS